jgi:hypothetical protein
MVALTDLIIEPGPLEEVKLHFGFGFAWRNAPAAPQARVARRWSAAPTRPLRKRYEKLGAFSARSSRPVLRPVSSVTDE